MARNPQYTRALTDDTMLAVLQGNNQDAFPIKYGDLKASIIGQSQQIGSFTYVTSDPEQPALQTITFGGTLGSANAIPFFSLPDGVNYDPASVSITTTGMTVNMIGGANGATVGYAVLANT